MLLMLLRQGGVRPCAVGPRSNPAPGCVSVPCVASFRRSVNRRGKHNEERNQDSLVL